MKTLHLSLFMLAVIIFLGFGLEPAHADYTHSISIQKINVQPSTLKVGDKFTVTATLVNNSTTPIGLEGGTCSIKVLTVPFFTVSFDRHAKIKTQNLTCAGVGLYAMLKPGEKLSGTSPDFASTYVAIESGTANATITFAYIVINQTDSTQPNIEQKISKSILFTIYDNNSIPMNDLHSHPVPFLASPLQQFKSGVAAKDVKCKEGLQLVIKSEDGSPACAKPDAANILIERGWTKEIVSQTGLIIPSKTAINELEIDLSNQTYEAGYPVHVNLKNVNHDSGCKIPSISVKNVLDQSLVFGPTPMKNYTDHCIEPWPITFYAGLEKNMLITKSTRYSILATLDDKIYQKEFTVIPSLYSNKNITADSTQIMPGYLTFTSCLPVSDVPNNGTLISYTGFDMYRRYLAGPDTGGISEIDDYLLKPGRTGSFVMQIHQGQFSKDANLAGGLYFLSENLLNLDNSTIWNNRPLASEAHPGLVLSYTPSFAKVGPEGYATITASIFALQNAPHGTYWLHLPPGICGGDLVLLTIGEQPLAQPPDYIGSDFASNFAQGVGNPTESDISFELINAGIHTFENCSLNYVSENQTTTIKTFNVIPPGMEYKYYSKLTSISKVSGFLECKKPPITKVYPDEGFEIIPY